MKRAPALIVVSLVALIAAAALLLSEDTDEPTATSAVKTGKAASGTPAQVLEGVVLEGADDKGGRWKVRAETAQADADGAVGVLNDVIFELTRPGSEAGTLVATAKKCAIDSDSSIELSGGAGIKWDQWRAQMQRAVYDMATQLISAEAGVTVTGETLRVSARTLEIDIVSDVATMSGGVKAVFEGKIK